MLGMVNFGSIFTSSTIEQQQIGIEFTKLLTWNTDGPANFAVDPDCQNGTLTIETTGVYNIIFTNQCNIRASGNHETVFYPRFHKHSFI